MEETNAEWSWIADEVRTAARDFSRQARLLDDGSIGVPNLEWNVGELVAHVASLPTLYREQNALAHFVVPSDWAAYSVEVRSTIRERELDELADRVIFEFTQMLDEFADDPWAPRVIYGQPTSGYNTAAGMLAELKLHGMDLARLTGEKLTLTRRQANAAIRQSMAVAPVFVDRDKARAFDGVYGLRFRGGDDYTYRFDDGVLTTAGGWPDRADARMRADPAAFVLLSLERMSPVKAALLGKVMVYGRRPWKLARTKSAVVDGV